MNRFTACILLIYMLAAMPAGAESYNLPPAGEHLPAGPLPIRIIETLTIPDQSTDNQLKLKVYYYYSATLLCVHAVFVT